LIEHNERFSKMLEILASIILLRLRNAAEQGESDLTLSIEVAMYKFVQAVKTLTQKSSDLNEKESFDLGIALNHVVSVWLKHKRFQLAHEAVGIAHGLSPNDPHIVRNMSALAAEQGELAEANALVGKLQREHPEFDRSRLEEIIGHAKYKKGHGFLELDRSEVIFEAVRQKTQEKKPQANQIYRDLLVAVHRFMIDGILCHAVYDFAFCFNGSINFR